MASSSPRTPAPERPPPPVPVPVPVPVSSPPPPLETPPPPSPSSQAGEDYHTPPPSLDASPREEAGLPSDDGSGRGGGGGAAAKSPQLSPIRRLLPPPASPTGQNGQQEGGGGGAAAASRARPPLSLMTGFLRTPSQGSVATNKSASPSPSPTPPSPLTPAPAPPSPLTPAPAVNRSGQSTPRHRAEAGKPPPSPAAAAAIAVTHFDPKEEAVTSPLRLGKAAGLDHQQYQHRQQQQRQQHAASATAENGGAVPPDVAAVAAVGERRALSVTLRVATAALSLAAFSVIASDRTSGWAGDYFARHQQYRYALAVNVIVCAYSIVQSIGEIRRLISPTFLFRSMSSYYLSLFLDQVLAYLLMSASSAAASRNDLWVSRFGTDAFNRKISSALWLSFIAFLMLALNALISTANLFSMA